MGATNERPIAVVGAGAVGSILAANFAKVGQRTVLVESDRARFDQVKRAGLTITATETFTVVPTTLLDSIDELREHNSFALFICTKAWTLRTILPQLAKVVRPDTLVISFQNGIGTEDEIATHIPAEQVARGIVNYAGAVVPDTGVVKQHWFNAPNYLGMLGDGSSERLVGIADTLSRATLHTQVIPPQEVKKRVFFKAILNSALMALCASSGITMRQAMTYRHTRHLAYMLIREGLSVAAALGYTYGENAMEKCLKYLDEGGDHLPSMWVDLQRGLPTEIEYINGKLVRLGMIFKNVSVELNAFFTSMIVTQEIKSKVRRPDEVPDYLTHF